MKKCTYSLFFACISIMHTYSQEIFTTHSENPSVNYVSITPPMFQMFGEIMFNDEDKKDLVTMVKSITKFKVLETKDINISKGVENWMHSNLKEYQLEEMARVKENNNLVSIYTTSPNENIVNRLVILINVLNSDNESILIWTEGDIDILLIVDMFYKMKLPGYEQIGNLQI